METVNLEQSLKEHTLETDAVVAGSITASTQAGDEGANARLALAEIIRPHGFAGQPDLQVPALSLKAWMAAVQAQDSDAKREFAEQLDDAFGRFGFAAIVDHGIDKALLDRAYGVIDTFFQSTTAEKSELIVPGSLGQRGYTPNGETAKGASVPDYKEFVQIGRSDNPAPRQLPDFLPALEALMDRFDEIGDNLLSALSLHEVDDERLLPDAVMGGRSILRAIHYPPLNADVPAFSERAAAHEDINFITLLLNARAMGDPVDASGQGLQIKVPLNGARAEHVASADLVWVNAVVPKDALIINVGEMLERWTNGAWRATRHRVVNPELGDPERSASRVSIPFFVHPRGEFSLAPHPASIARAGGQQRYAAMSADQALQERLLELRSADRSEQVD